MHHQHMTCVLSCFSHWPWLVFVVLLWNTDRHLFVCLLIRVNEHVLVEKDTNKHCLHIHAVALAKLRQKHSCFGERAALCGTHGRGSRCPSPQKQCSRFYVIWYEDSRTRGFVLYFSIPTLPNAKEIFYGGSDIFSLQILKLECVQSVLKRSQVSQAAPPGRVTQMGVGYGTGTGAAFWLLVIHVDRGGWNQKARTKPYLRRGAWVA